jgi:hypothetical protein
MPNMGLGGNSGIESVVVLTNHLHQFLADNNQAKPSGAELQKVFHAYQTERYDRVNNIYKFSNFVNEAQGWSTWWYWFMSTWLVPLLPQRLLADQLGGILSAGAKLDFVDVGNFPSGRMPWKNSAKTEASKEQRSLSKNSFGGLSVITGLLIISYYYYAARSLPLTANI